MALSNKTYHNLAKALQDEVIEYIQTDDRYMDFMMEIVGDAIISKLGNIDSSILGELSMVIIDNLSIKPSRI